MPKNVVITPLSGLLDFYDLNSNLDAKIQVDDGGSLNITNTGGTLTLGNTAANVYIGDGTNSVDVIFEQNGAIRALTGKTLTLGNSASNVAITSPLSVTNNITTSGVIVSTGASYRIATGTDAGGNLNLGRIDNVASTPFIDFNCGGTTVDHDVRLQATGGTGANGGGLLTLTGNLSLTGNFTVNGTTTTVNSTTVTIDDPIFTLGGDVAPTVDDNKDRGVEFRWHNGTAAKVGFFGYDDSTGYLTFIPDATNTSEVFSGTQGDIQATNFRGALVGNSSTATTLQTARNINGVSFNGSTDITVADSTKLPLAGGTLSGNTTISTSNPILILKDNDNSGTGIGQTGYISFQDSTNTERAWIGYGSTTSTDLNISNTRGSVNINGNIALHSANYNTYSPTLTGTGASGTWGISVTGNAATVTNGAYLNTTNTFTGINTFNSNVNFATSAGNIVNFNSTNVRANVFAVPASEINITNGNYFSKTATGALTWTIVGTPISNTVCTVVLQLTNGGLGAQTWPGSVAWDSGVPPTLSANGVDIIMFITTNSGTTWRGVQVYKS